MLDDTPISERSTRPASVGMIGPMSQFSLKCRQRTFASFRNQPVLADEIDWKTYEEDVPGGVEEVASPCTVPVSSSGGASSDSRRWAATRGL